MEYVQLALSGIGVLAAAGAALFAYPSWRLYRQRSRRRPRLVVLPINGRKQPNASVVEVSLLLKNTGDGEVRNWRMSVGTTIDQARLDVPPDAGPGELTRRASVRHVGPMHDVDVQALTEADVLPPDHDRILRILVWPTRDAAALRVFANADGMHDQHTRLIVKRDGSAVLKD